MRTLYLTPALSRQWRGLVVWVNKDPFPHTATFTGHFDSKSIAAGASWKYKASTVGDFAYTCTFHPNTKGTLKVE